MAEIEARVLAETPRGAEPRFWEDVQAGDQLDVVTKGPIGLTDEIAFVAGGGTPIPRLKAHAAALHDYKAHSAWSFRDPVTSALEPIYSVHYNLQAANAMSAEYQYDVGFQRQSWQIHHLTHWCGDDGWIKENQAQYRKFVYLSDVIELTGEVTGKDRLRRRARRAHRTTARNQRGETVMPGTAVVALPARDGGQSPAASRARSCAMTTIPIGEFLATAEALLASRYPPPAPPDGDLTGARATTRCTSSRNPTPSRRPTRCPPSALAPDLWEAGLAWIYGPPEYGGAGLPAAFARGFEQLARRYQVPGDSALTVSLGMIAPTILRHGTEEQRLHWLPRLYSGQQIACQLFSEPGAGSDLAAVSTRAVPDGSRWRISGQKVWTSGAHLADIGEILCRSADEPRHRNLTAFLISMDAPGVTVRPLRQMTGGAAFNEVFLDDVPVDDQRRLGPAGDGWNVALTTLGYERRAMGHPAFGGAGILSTERLIGLVRAMNKDGDPVVRQEFGELISRLRTARYVQEVQAAQARAGEPAGPELALGKIALSDNFRRLAAFVADVIGPEAVADTGAWGTYAWTSVLLGAPGYRLGAAAPTSHHILQSPSALWACPAQPEDPDPDGDTRPAGSVTRRARTASDAARLPG